MATIVRVPRQTLADCAKETYHSAGHFIGPSLWSLKSLRSRDDTGPGTLRIQLPTSHCEHGLELHSIDWKDPYLPISFTFDGGAYVVCVEDASEVEINAAQTIYVNISYFNP
jgi:hypothetical protein